MTEQPEYCINLELRRRLPDVLDCSSSFDLEIIVEADLGYVPAGVPWTLFDDSDSIVASGLLPEARRLTPDDPEYDPRHGQVDERPFVTLTIPTPRTTGTHRWQLDVDDVEIDGHMHEGAALLLDMNIRNHRMGLQIWDIPSPVESEANFTARIGLRCTSGCPLEGYEVDVVDEAGHPIARARIGDVAAPGTAGLYFCDVSMRAPASIGRHDWRVNALAHDGDQHHDLPPSAALNFFVVPKSDHSLRIRVADEQSDAPIPHATVRLGLYRALTDADGYAVIRISAGDYSVRVMKDTYVSPEHPVSVTADLDLDLHITIPPEKDPLERYWKQ